MSDESSAFGVSFVEMGMALLTSFSFDRHPEDEDDDEDEE